MIGKVVAITLAAVGGAGLALFALWVWLVKNWPRP